MSWNGGGSSSEMPYIVVSGIKLSEGPASQELTSAGFLLQSSFSFSSTRKGSTGSVLVSLSDELVSRLAFNLMIKVESSWGAYNRLHQLKILSGAVRSLTSNNALRGGGKMFLSGGVIKRPELSTVAAWIAHDQSRLAVINVDHHQQQRVTRMAEYYGPQIGFYFGFLDYYTACLLLPSVLGLLLFVHQTYLGSLDSPYAVSTSTLSLLTAVTYFSSIHTHACVHASLHSVCS